MAVFNQIFLTVAYFLANFRQLPKSVSKGFVHFLNLLAVSQNINSPIKQPPNANRRSLFGGLKLNLTHATKCIERFWELLESFIQAEY